jgi:hypothetical protein
MAIDDFSLVPLVSPVPICSSISNSPLLAKSPKGGDKHVAQPTDSVPSSDVPTLSSSGRVGVPMCILVCGHLQEGTSAQELWSRRGFFVPIPSIATATESLMASSSSSSVAITTAVLHETIEAGVESIVGYRFAAKDPSLAVDELTVSIEASSVSAPGQCGVLVEAATESEALLGSISEWEDVDESIGTYSPFSLSQQFLLQWEPCELKSLDLTFQKIMLDNVLGRLKGMVKKEVLKVSTN